MGEPTLHLGPESDTVVLATFRNSTEASLALANLREAGIPSALGGTTVADVAPQFVGGGRGGGVRLLVKAADVERAGKYLPDTALGRPAVVADLDRRFKNGLLLVLAGAGVLAGINIFLAMQFGETGVLIGAVSSFLVVVAFLTWLRSGENDDDDREDESNPDKSDPH